MRVLSWLLRAALFLTLFAFALNNQHEASFKWFFGHEWRAPMVFILLAAFIAGCTVGVLAMLPSWWRHRQAARSGQDADTALPAPTTAPAPPPPDQPLNRPPVDGL
jgi:uncharacterized integral membrane protein